MSDVVGLRSAVDVGSKLFVAVIVAICVADDVQTRLPVLVVDGDSTWLAVLDRTLVMVVVGFCESVCDRPNVTVEVLLRVEDAEARSEVVCDGVGTGVGVGGGIKLIDNVSVCDTDTEKNFVRLSEREPETDS